MREDVERRPDRLAATVAAMLALLVAAIVAGAAPARAAAKPDEPQAIVTIVDGPAQLMRDDKRLRLEEGVRLLLNDIVETAADARVTRIEFRDGLAFNLGPSTRVLVDPQFWGEKGRFARLYLLSGWLKLRPAAAPPKAAAAATPVALLASPAIEVLEASGSLVVQVDDAAAAVFVESGTTTVQERRAGRPVGEPRPLANGQFMKRPAQGEVAVAARPAADFIERMPRSFLDTLPDRAAMFNDRWPPPRPLGPIRYDDARDWLAVEPTLRGPAMGRWLPLTRDPQFRKGLIANMKAHPEWDRVLFPEKYRSAR